MRPLSEDLPYQVGEHRPRPHLHKGPHPGCVHALDLLHKFNRVAQLLPQLAPHGRAGFGIRPGVGVGINRHRGSLKPNLL